MTTDSDQPSADITIRTGVVLLSATVSSVVWWRICLWLWNWAARQGWWEPAGDGARVVLVLVATAVTWLLWGRIAYWLSMPNQPSLTAKARGPLDDDRDA